MAKYRENGVEQNNFFRKNLVNATNYITLQQKFYAKKTNQPLILVFYPLLVSTLMSAAGKPVGRSWLVKQQSDYQQRRKHKKNIN